jgi:hypothetical protein
MTAPRTASEAEIRGRLDQALEAIRAMPVDVANNPPMLELEP